MIHKLPREILMSVLTIYTDGACNKQYKGGLGVIFLLNHKEYLGSVSLYSENTTNNQMELGGAIVAVKRALQYLDETDMLTTSVEILTDSEYVQKGINQWIHNWKKKNWRNSANENVKNKEYWLVMDSAIKTLRNSVSVSVKKVKGHAGVVGNELADVLAETSYSSDNIPDIIMDKLKKRAIKYSFHIEARDIEKYHEHLHYDGEDTEVELPKLLDTL